MYINHNKVFYDESSKSSLGELFQSKDIFYLSSKFKMIDFYKRRNKA